MARLSVQEISKEFGVSVPTAYRMVKGLDGVKQGRRTLYDIDTLHSKIELEKKQPALNYSELGSSSFRRWGETVAEERLRALRGREGRILFREMHINDPVINAVFLATENALRRVSWRVKPASEAESDRVVAEYIDSCFSDMSFSFTDTLQFVLNFLEQGFSVVELVYKKRNGEDVKGEEAPSKYEDGRIGWRKWSPRPAESLAPGREWIFDKNGGVQGIRQELDQGTTTNKVVEIPIEKLLLFRTTVAPANSPEGVPIHRAAYTSWHFSNNLAEIEGIGIERELTGLPVIYMGADTKKRGSNSDFDQAKDIVTNLRSDEQAGVVFPYPKLGTAGDNRGILLELITSSGRRSYNTSEIIKRWDYRKAMSCLAQFIMLGAENVGSYALGRLQADIFVLAVSAWATNIAETINRFAIPRLLKYNSFPGMTGYPQIVPSDVGIPNLEEMAVYVNTLTNSGLIKPDLELERHLRQIAHLPSRDETPEDQQASTGGAGTAIRNQQAILRATRAGLILERLRRLQDKGTLSPEEVSPMMTAARDELMDALGSNDVGGLADLQPQVNETSTNG